MTRALLVLGITLAAALPAKADITHKIQSSVQLQVDGAASQASRIGSTLAVSGSNVTLDTAPVLGTLTAGDCCGLYARCLQHHNSRRRLLLQRVLYRR